MRYDIVNDESLWVIKDDQNHFATTNSICKFDKDTWVYISSKTFSPECKGYTNKKRAEDALISLSEEVNNMELDIKFHLEYKKSKELTKEHKLLKGENLVYKKISDLVSLRKTAI